MSLFESNQERREVDELHRLAMDAHRESQYATMERLLEQAAMTAKRLDDLPLLIQECFYLADARRMQSKDTQALATYTWLIGLASDPTHSSLLSGENTLWFLARAFTEFVSCGRFLALPSEQLLRVVADGLAWLDHVGKTSWAAGLRLQRGTLLKGQQRWQEARLELEAALALSRRHPTAPGYGLASYLLCLAELLCEEAVGAYAEALPLIEEVLAAPESEPYGRQWTYEALAKARLGLHEHEAALQAARQSLTLALSIANTASICSAYQVLGQISRRRGRPDEAAAATAQEWRWARKDETVQYLHNALQNCVRVRLLQARQACQLPPAEEELPPHLPAEAQRELARRRVEGVRRFARWARPLAAQLDEAKGGRAQRERLDKLERQAEQLTALLGRQGEG